MCVPVQVLLSGGVDSTVCTALLNKALNPDQVIAVHIDNGFMRKRESQSVEEALTKLGIKLHGEPCYMAVWPHEWLFTGDPSLSSTHTHIIHALDGGFPDARRHAARPGTGGCHVRGHQKVPRMDLLQCYLLSHDVIGPNPHHATSPVAGAS